MTSPYQDTPSGDPRPPRFNRLSGSSAMASLGPNQRRGLFGCVGCLGCLGLLAVAAVILGMIGAALGLGTSASTQAPTTSAPSSATATTSRPASPSTSFSKPGAGGSPAPRTSISTPAPAVNTPTPAASSVFEDESDGEDSQSNYDTNSDSDSRSDSESDSAPRGFVAPATPTKTYSADPAPTREAAPETSEAAPETSEAAPAPRETYTEEAEEETPTGGNVYYKNCDAVRAAGAAPIKRGDPGYAKHLDRDGDGQGCAGD